MLDPDELVLFGNYQNFLNYLTSYVDKPVTLENGILKYKQNKFSRVITALLSKVQYNIFPIHLIILKTPCHRHALFFLFW